MLKILYFLPF